jgi:predicted Rossmann fold flavoprotein
MKTAVDWDVIVIGAGAAGMMCAAQAGQRGRRVLLVDHSSKLAEKIRISGGGRCNFTNLHCRPENYLSQNPHFCRSALVRFTPQHFIAMVERYGIRYHEKTLGQLFCDDSAQQIIAMLQAECSLGKVTWRMACNILSVIREDNSFHVATDQGQYRAPALVIATGGLTVPKIGASPFAYRIAEQFGLKIIPPRPALVPLSLTSETLAQFGDLSGISLDVEVSCNGGRFRDRLLLTHRGLSGPAILQISSYWNPGDFISINLVPNRNILSWLMAAHSSRTRLDNLLSELLPKRFAQQWCAINNTAKPMQQFTSAELSDATNTLCNWQVRPSGTLGYNKAEVTLGGVDTDGLSSKTMESKSVPGLYFIGEAVDVTGHLGGFNFQWAWASGNAAGNAV